jgi:RND family efflux transporter MFP subunit
MKGTAILWLCGAALAGLSGCGAKPEEKVGAAEPAGLPIPVHLGEVRQVEWPSLYDAVGTVRASNSTQVSGRVMAYVREVRVRVGDRVRQGQTLVLLDARDLDSRQRQAEAAGLEAATAAAEADHSIESARAQLELAEITHKRMTELFSKASISNQEFDESSARVRVARAALEMAQAKRKQVDAKVAQSVEETRGAQIMTGYTTINAPFAGIVTEKPVEAGNLAVPGAPLLTIEREGGYRLEVAVEESNLAKVRLGQKVRISLDALAHPVEGSVVEIVPAVDPVSRQFVAKISLPAAANIRSGMFGRAQFIVGARKAVVVPAAALAPRGQMQWLFVAEGARARGRIVTVGAANGNDVELLSGAGAGEKIVSPVPAGLLDGARLEVRP